MTELQTYFYEKWNMESELAESDDESYRRQLRVELHDLVKEAEAKFTPDELMFGWVLMIGAVQD